MHQIKSQKKMIVQAMVVLAVEPELRVLEPQEELSTATLDAILLGDVQWSLYDRSPADPPTHYADWFAVRELIPADLFLQMDPLVSLSTMIAGRRWVAAGLVAFSVVVV